MGDSVLTTQVGLDEKIQVADSLNTNAQDLRADARKVNINAKTKAEDDYHQLKMALADRREEVKAQGLNNLIDGATGVVGYLNEPKYLASLKNQGTPTQPPVMGYTNTTSTGGGFGQGKSALSFGRTGAYGVPSDKLPQTSSVQSQVKAVKTGKETINPNSSTVRRADTGKIGKKKKKGSFFRNTTYSRNANGK